jgi:phosphomannomutase
VRKQIALFDVDGTLTLPRQIAEQKVLDFMIELRKHVNIAIVGGSDFAKIKEQIGENVLDLFDYTFAENGLVAYKSCELIGFTSIKEFLGEVKLQELINYILRYIADLQIPVKRGTFIEFRNGMINVSPIGRNCSQEEREAFAEFDNTAKIREEMIENLKKNFDHLNLTYSIGGQISIDIFPNGWDKTYCLQYLEEYTDIHFFGDKTYLGGNDYEIYNSDKTIGHHVNSPDDTIRFCKEFFIFSD